MSTKLKLMWVRIAPLRDDIHIRKNYFKRALLVKLRPPPSRKRARWSFFRMSKTAFKCVLQNVVQIDYNNENYEYNDDNGDTIDDYDNEKDRKSDKYHGVILKIYPF